MFVRTAPVRKLSTIQSRQPESQTVKVQIWSYIYGVRLACSVCRHSMRQRSQGADCENYVAKLREIARPDFGSSVSFSARRYHDQFVSHHCGGRRARSGQEPQTGSLHRSASRSCGPPLNRTPHGWPQWLLGYGNVELLGR
jgi:hypothetical protein